MTTMLTAEEALAYAEGGPSLAELCERARACSRSPYVTFSPKVFIPLTHLCRDVCHYCTFARPPRRGERCYMSEDEVLAVAEAGRLAGCHEALFTLGDKPELRYRAAREELERLGFPTTAAYLAHCAGLVLRETGLLPHANPGILDDDELLALREVSASQGIMLETASARLSQRGGPHFGSPDKLPDVRLDAIDRAGRLAIPYTSGILIGIGETRRERVEALLALRDLHERHGHLQEVIVQNFRAKPGTKMAEAPEPTLDDHLWTIAVTRLLMPLDVAVQAPPNLAHAEFPRLLEAGIDDFGGVSPVTPDHVNPEAPWPERSLLAAATAAAGRTLAPRLPIYPRYLREAERWLAPAVRGAALAASDGDGLARDEGSWFAGTSPEPPPAWQNGRRPRLAGAVSSPFARALERSERGSELSLADAEALLSARGPEVELLARAADARRAERSGDEVTYVVCRNINYTNVCYFRCGFCAFSKGRLAANLRGPAYLLGVDEVVRRCAEAWDRGATEVCLQGGIHPGFTGTWYLELVRAIRAALPDLHVHAFSPLEVWQGAATEGWELQDYLEQLRDAGLGSLPGTAAEVLDDEVRRVLCPDKLRTEQWLEVMRTAHAVGPADDVDDHVRAHRGAHPPGPPHPRHPRPAARERRLHRVRPSAVRARGGADRAQGPGTARPHLPRGRRPARGGAPGARPARDEHPGLVGEARPRRRPRAARRRRERPRRHAHERVDQPCRRREPRTGVPARAHGGSHPGRGSRAAPAHDALRGRPGRADRRLVRRRAARTGRSAALRRRWAAAPRPPDPARPDQRVGNLPGSAESSRTGARKGYC